MNADDARWSADEQQRQAAPKRPRRDWSGAVVGLCFGLAGLALARLGWLRIQLDVFSAFTVQAALLAVASGVALFVPKYKTLVASLLFSLALVAYGLWPALPVTNDRDAPAGSKRLRVATFNIDVGSDRPDQIMSSLKKLDADVVVLTEYENETPEFTSALEQFYPHIVPCETIKECDVIIASRLPLTAVSGTLLSTGPDAVAARLGPDYDNALIVGVHTAHFPDSQRQFDQLSALSKRLATEQGPMIVTGDFNATTQSRLVQDFGNSLDLQQAAHLPTYPTFANLPQLAIDQIMVRTGIITLGPEAASDAAGSDHIPIARTFAIPTSR